MWFYTGVTTCDSAYSIIVSSSTELCIRAFFGVILMLWPSKWCEFYSWPWTFFFLADSQLVVVGVFLYLIAFSTTNKNVTIILA